VAEALRDNMQRHAAEQQQGCVGVAQVIQPDRGHGLGADLLLAALQIAGELA
jgi:hypothetical protein